MKQYYFISGLPRSGSTLLSAILRQNPDFYADIASPVEAIAGKSIELITNHEVNFVYAEEQRKNLLYGVFEGYYQHIEKPVIFDSSRSWTKKTNVLQALFPYTKILCPVRDTVSIINSFEVLLNKNCFYTKKIGDKVFSENGFNRTEEIFEKFLLKCNLYLKEGYTLNPEMIYFIEYENLCKEPEKTIRGVYEFLEKPYYSHDFENVDYSNEIFDNACNAKDLHTVRRKVKYKPPRIILPPEIVQEYKDMKMEFWRKNNKMNSDIVEYK